MAEANAGRHRHFILEGITETEEYRRPGGGGQRTSIPEQDRIQHGGALLGQLEECRSAADAAREIQQTAGFEGGLGLQVEFESFPDVELAFESLARERQGIELLNVRHDETRTLATVFVPDGKLDHFEGLIRDYLEEKRDRAGRPRDNRRLIDAIQQIRAASIRALWTDDDEAFPTPEEGPLWWEVWLPRQSTPSDPGVDQILPPDGFRQRAEAQGMQVAQGEARFPERTVLLVRASLGEMQRSMVTLNSIAELRRAKETAEFFDSLERDEQRAWLDDLLARTRFAGDAEETPYVCLLDTGVNQGHRLLAPALDARDLHTVEPGWGTDDAKGHGTEMAGVALAGNLAEILESSDPVEIDHRLESVKLLPKDGATGTDPRHAVRLFDTQQEEADAVGQWLQQCASEGVSPGEMGVFVRSAAQLDRARKAVAGAGLLFRVLDERGSTGGDRVSISTMHLAKGLEFRAVAVMACDDEVVPLQDRIENVADDADLEEVYDTERHLLYVACTRARDHLMITAVEPASEFLDDLHV